MDSKCAEKLPVPAPPAASIGAVVIVCVIVAVGVKSTPEDGDTVGMFGKSILIGEIVDVGIGGAVIMVVGVGGIVGGCVGGIVIIGDVWASVANLFLKFIPLGL